MIIGAKGLEHQTPFCESEIRELLTGVDQLLKQGMPPEVPAAFPIGQLGRIAVTLKRYREVAQNLVTESNDTEPNYATIVEQAQAILTIAPPMSVPSPSAPPAKSRLIIPS